MIDEVTEKMLQKPSDFKNETQLSEDNVNVNLGDWSLLLPAEVLPVRTIHTRRRANDLPVEEFGAYFSKKNKP